MFTFSHGAIGTAFKQASNIAIDLHFLLSLLSIMFFFICLYVYFFFPALLFCHPLSSLNFGVCSINIQLLGGTPCCIARSLSYFYVLNVFLVTFTKQPSYRLLVAMWSCIAPASAVDEAQLTAVGEDGRFVRCWASPVRPSNRKNI